MFTKLLRMTIGAAILWLLYTGMFYLATTLPDIQTDVNTLKSDVKALKDSTTNKAELAEAKLQLKQEITEQLKSSQATTKR